MKKFFFSLLIGVYAIPGYATQTYKMAEGKRIEASICPTEMNRISIPGDRISQVFGAEGKFTHQVDEETGQFFLKPLSQQEGGLPQTPVSLTLITESGLTQDLTLLPKEKSAATILLKADSEQSKVNNTPLPFFEGLGRALPYQEVLIQAFRILASEGGKGEGERRGENDFEIPSHRANAEGVMAYFVRQSKGSQYGVQVFEITNSSKEHITLQEKQFFQTGDLALALSKTVLKPEEKAILYVIRRG